MSENEDSLFFNSDFFDEDLFENMMIQKKSEKATKTQKLELLEFIGGFEKWEFLPDDCKMYVIGFLNYWTRKTPPFKCTPQQISSVRGDFTNPKIVTTALFQISNSNSQKEYEKIVKKVMKRVKRNVETLEVDWKTNPEGLEIEKLDKLKYLKMNFWKSESVEFWLSRLNSEIALEEFILQCWEVLNFEQLDYPSILNAASFFVPKNIVMSDEQFLRMSNRKSLFRADTLSSKVLMEFVRKWVDDEIREDFEQLTVWTKKNFVKDIFENLDSYNFNVVQYDYGRWNIPLYREFFSHFEKFGYYGKFWQFSKRNDPFNSISLLITRQNFVVLRTGFPCFKNGRQDVKLVFPEDILFCNIYF
ncbi:hypothetical protein L3Y34_006998 [Caenorhabditis briggsae]|uniref:F-box associated domain-containing protein n=1 Tax=Caenorhabditis briggsae TaxID=6238 RepID=A0AAE9A2V3_CAEBR|nr:hypothetical protein L3Y34_006998 [Caenorhabditis briggsae]